MGSCGLIGNWLKKLEGLQLALFPEVEPYWLENPELKRE
jgi:hypothetical protein